MYCGKHTIRQRSDIRIVISEYTVQDAKLKDAQAEVQQVKKQLQKCQDRLHQQETVHSTEVKELQTRIDKLTQQLRQAEAAQPAQTESVQPVGTVTSMVRMLQSAANVV